MTSQHSARTAGQPSLIVTASGVAPMTDPRAEAESRVMFAVDAEGDDTLRWDEYREAIRKAARAWVEAELEAVGCQECYVNHESAYCGPEPRPCPRCIRLGELRAKQ